MPEQLEQAKDTATGPIVKELADEFRKSTRSLKGLLKVSVDYHTDPELSLQEPADMVEVESRCHPWEPFKIAEDWAQPVQVHRLWHPILAALTHRQTVGSEATARPNPKERSALMALGLNPPHRDRQPSLGRRVCYCDGSVTTSSRIKARPGAS